MKRGLLALAAAVLVAGTAVGLAEVLVKPGPIEQLRAERIKRERRRRRADRDAVVRREVLGHRYAEGPRGAAAPTQIRIISPDGGAMEPRPTQTLDPAVNVGVCPNERPPLGTTWWSGAVPHELAEQLRSSGQTAWRFEAYGRMGWVPRRADRLGVPRGRPRLVPWTDDRAPRDQ